MKGRGIDFLYGCYKNENIVYHAMYGAHYKLMLVPYFANFVVTTLCVLPCCLGSVLDLPEGCNFLYSPAFKFSLCVSQLTADLVCPALENCECN